MRFIRLAAMGLSCAITPQVFAVDCEQAHQGASEIAACEEYGFKLADAELNRVYQELEQAVARQRPEMESAVQQAQQLWVSFRDAQCSVETWDMSGEAYTILLNQCQTRLTEQRTAYLQNMQNTDAEEVSQSAASTGPAWFVVLGSFKMNDKGLKAANKLADSMRSALDDDSIIMGESSFYKGFAEGLYVVLKGPFSEQNDAKSWLKIPTVKKQVPDAYVKQAQAQMGMD